MTVAEFIFYVFSVVAIVGAVGTVTLPNVVHAALFLIASLLATAAFYILLSSEFLALVQVLIYAGAVATIILFALMLTRRGDMPTVTPGAQWPLGLLVAASLAVVLLIAVLDTDWPRDVGRVTAVSIETIGETLFTTWLVPFEIASLVLLVALVGAIVISKQEEEEG